MTPHLVINISSALWVVPIAVFILFCGIVFVALYLKGDVFAEFTLGKTSLRLAARDKLVKK
jgi:hypothetical protein